MQNNNLTQFREDQAVLNSVNGLTTNPIATFVNGFNSCSKLNLPIHFSEFLTSHFIVKLGSPKKCPHLGFKQL